MPMMWLIGVGVALQLLSLLVLVFIELGISKKMREYETAISEKVKAYEDSVLDFIQPQGDKPSKLVDFIDIVSANVASRIVSSAEAAIRGSAGGLARAEKAEMLASNPLAGLMSGRLGKNNLIGALLQAVLNKVGSGTPAEGKISAAAEGVPSNGHSDHVRFKFGG